MTATVRGTQVRQLSILFPNLTGHLLTSSASCTATVGAGVSPVCGRARARLSIFTASTGPSADTGSPVNGEDNRGESDGPGFGGAPLLPGRTATSAAASPMAAAADTAIAIFRRGHLMTSPPAGLAC